MKKFLCLFILNCLLLSCLVSCNGTTPDVGGKSDGSGDVSGEGGALYAVPVRITVTYVQDEEAAKNDPREESEVVTLYKNSTIDIFYNEKNLPSKQVITYDDGIGGTFDFEYDEKNNLIRKTLNSLGTLSFEYSYSYDESNRLIKKLYTRGGSKYVYEYAYDEMGNLTYDSTYEDWRDTRIIKRYTYDDNGNQIKYQYSTSYDYHNDTTYFYNADGVLVSATETNADGNYTVGKHEFSYDADGRLARKVFTCNGTTKMREYTYDLSGDLLTELYTVIHETGVVSTLMDEYLYDEKNNLIEHVVTSDGVKMSCHRYTYDGDGNVVEYVYTDQYGLTQTIMVEYKTVSIPFEPGDVIRELLTPEYYTNFY